jgi:AraC-like DNA-binding protein
MDQMASSAVQTFTDPDACEAALPAKAELTVIGRGQFTAKIARIDLHRLHLFRFDDNLPRARHSTYNSEWAVVSFRTGDGPSLVRAGREMLPTNIVRAGEGEEVIHRSYGPTSNGAMWLRVEDMASVGATMAGGDLTPPRDAMIVSPPPGALEKLRRLHAAAGHLAEEAPEIIANPDAARGLEQTLIEAMVRCLAQQDDRETSVAQGQHAIVMRRFRRVLEENPERPLFIPEICEAIRVSERTLRVCCQEHLGISPKHYLLLRRMHMTRRALRERAASATTVTEVATQYGFWQLGRFAVEYRALFGESPSATMRRTTD